VARQSRAGAVIVSKKDATDYSFTQIRVDSPSLAFTKIVELFAPPAIQYPPGIHPSAVISPKAKLGENVSIQPGAVIEEGVTIGARSVIGANVYVGHETVIGDDVLIYPNVSIRERTVIGKRVIIHCGTVIGSDGFGYELKEGCHKKIPQIGYVQIDDDVEIGANTTIDRGRFDKTWIQAGAKIDNLVMIAHNVIVGKHSIIVSQVGISGSTTLGSYVTLAGQAGLAGHLNIGDRSVVTAQAGLNKDVPAGAIVAGHHALPLRESLKLEAYGRRIPELFERIKALEEEIKRLKPT
jgi:UDP-3-O-[3-hydroxymyristoyl] glucosamine N-acyltransferase